MLVQYILRKVEDDILKLSKQSDGMLKVDEFIYAKRIFTVLSPYTRSWSIRVEFPLTAVMRLSLKYRPVIKAKSNNCYPK